jgi:apolipoprotein N-acyltransferase
MFQQMNTAVVVAAVKKLRAAPSDFHTKLGWPAEARQKALNTTSCNKQKRFYKKLKALSVVVLPELKIASAMADHSKAEKEAALKKLQQKYSDLWLESITDGCNASSKPAPAKSKEKQEKEEKDAYVNAIYLRTGNNGNKQYLDRNITPLVPGMPLKLGCIVSNLPLAVMQALSCQYYGQPEAQHTCLC